METLTFCIVLHILKHGFRDDNQKFNTYIGRQQPAPIDFMRVPSYHEAGHTYSMIKKQGLGEIASVTCKSDDISEGHVETFYPGARNDQRQALENTILGAVSGRAATEIYTGFLDLPEMYQGDYDFAKQIINQMLEQGHLEKPDSISYEDFYTKILDSKLQEAKDFLTENRNELDLLANTLNERGTMSRKEIFQLLNIEDATPAELALH